MDSQLVVDQHPAYHANGCRREYRKVHPRRSQRLQLKRIGEKIENSLTRMR